MPPDTTTHEPATLEVAQVPFDPTNPPPPKPINPEEDPDLLIQSMIARRRKPPAPAAAKPEPKAEVISPETAPEQTDEQIKARDGETMALINKRLGFRDPPEKKPAAEVKTNEKPPETAAEGDKTGEDEEKPTAKTIVAKKKPAPPPIDHARIVSEATTAATREAMKGLQPAAPLAPPGPEEGLSESDRRQYEVAKYMASNNPKFKGAEKVVLAHIAKSNAHALNWEKENPGKAFNPKDKEHDEFYESLEKPWSDEEFIDARVEMAAERIADKKNRETQAQLEELRLSQGRNDLSQAASIAHTFAAAQIVKAAAGEHVLESIKTDGFEKLRTDDPITAECLVRNIDAIQPMIEVMVQLDDPKKRVPFDPNNELHQTWKQFLEEKEAQYVGQQDAKGRTYCTRREYVSMNPAQRPNYCYLDGQTLGAELVKDTIAYTKEQIKTEQERVKKIAASIGYVPAPVGDQGKPAGGKRADAPRPAVPATATNGAPVSIKPNSPASAGGVTTDNMEDPPKTEKGAVFDAMAKILWGR